MVIKWESYGQLISNRSLVLDGQQQTYLVGGFNPSEKIWESMGRIIPYIMENKNMFETTNQMQKQSQKTSNKSKNIQEIQHISAIRCYPHHPHRFSERRATADTNSKSRHCHRGSSLLEILGGCNRSIDPKCASFGVGGNRTLRRPNWRPLLALLALLLLRLFQKLLQQRITWSWAKLNNPPRTPKTTPISMYPETQGVQHTNEMDFTLKRCWLVPLPKYVGPCWASVIVMDIAMARYWHLTAS